ncbi:NodT family efflux transporter outer membrane factor (OMF) lipoprotein [Marinomonas pollencensis]|uniref:NodT family efflux transporter outer membrane factor (OMF) lipoprotein n=2 Tax=Marinomonas pollencensis TaxID=491954 RepID=A0A3E0DR03_9GAMM|nr:NodT family efflux transporter outer membrane factor (OMF) lipoprotein [Marinomonas pollencensis]
MNNRLIQVFGLGVISLIVSGCSLVGPDYQRPDTPTSEQFKEAQGWKEASPADLQPKGAWWQVYQDDPLSKLLKQVEINNQNVAEYAADYEKAKEVAEEAGTNLYPTIGANAGATRSGSQSQTSNAYSAQATVSWEIDLWGKLRRTREANLASAQASAAELASATLSAQSSLAQDYFQLRVLDEKIRLYQTNIAVYEKYLKVVTNQYQLGNTSSASVSQAQTQLHSTRVSMLDLQWQRAQFEHAIAVLIGQPPAAFSITPTSLSFTLPSVPTTLPSTLLERRPDIAFAERSMASANASVGVAIAGYYPDLSLSASAGFENSVLGNLFELPSRAWSIGPSLSGNIFDFGATKAQVKQAKAEYAANVANYRQTVLSAFQEVEDYLVEMRILEDEIKAQTLATKYAKESARVTFNQFKLGMIDYLDVATTEATSLTQQQSQLSLISTQLVNSVQLIAALGGGWDSHQLPTAKAPDSASKQAASATRVK